MVEERSFFCIKSNDFDEVSPIILGRPKRRSFFCLVVISLTIGLAAQAQIVIHRGDFPLAGFTYASHQVFSGAEFDVGSAGENQTWTFGNYTWEQSVITQIVDPDDTPYSELFPDASRAIHATDGGSYVFEFIDDDECSMLGLASPENTDIFDEAMLEMPLPALYGSEWNTVGRFTHELEPGMVMTLVDSSQVIADGWGSVVTPFGSHEVLRFFAHHYMRSFLNDVLISEAEYLSYAWVNHDGISVVNVDSDDDVVDPNFSYGIIEMNEYAFPVEPSPVELPRELAVGIAYPNPFNATTVLPIELANRSPVRVEVFDAVGRVVLQENFTFSAGRHELRLGSTAWPSGYYFARVSVNRQFETRKMILLK